MKTIYNKLIVLLLLLSVGLSAADKATESMIFSAMNDELARNMSDLKYKDFQSPFYISYTVNDLSNATVHASLGALIESSANTNVSCSARLMVGSYALNDEKFNDKVNRVWYNDGNFSNLEKPDYYGIRRSLWLQTNNVYKAASEKYKNKLDLMQKEGLTQDDLNANDFSQEDAVVYLEPSLSMEKDQQFFEEWAKELSLAFADYKDLIESSVILKYANQTSYITDSEGRKVQLPSRLYSVLVKAKILSDKNKAMSQYLRYYGQSFDELPSIAVMKNDVKALVNNLYAQNKAPEYRGKYEGPLLIQDNAVFYKGIISLLRRGNGLMTNPRSLVNDKQKGLFLATYFTWEDMKGKRVIDKKMSVTAIPHLERYDETPLLGSAKCDREGIKTADTLELISQGVLQCQLGNRTPTPSQPHSNAHSLPYFKNNTFGQQVITSVIKVEASQSVTQEAMFQQLVALAKEEDLDHALIIKPLATSANEAPINTYRVDLSSGEEVLVSGTSYSAKVSELKKVEAFGEQNILTNTLVANQAALDSKRKQMARYPEWIKEIINMQMGDEGAPSSFIYPSAMLLKSTTVTGTNNASRSKARVVPSPLAQN